MPIVAISGGELSTGETRPIDEYIVSLSGKAACRVLFVPTASGDSESYAAGFRDTYGTALGCDVSTLNLLSGHDGKRADEMARWADVIYVGGGNPRLLMDSWVETGFIGCLRTAWQQGKVLCGVSAGAMCWFGSGFSDFESFASESDAWELKPLECMGLLGGMFCPHLDTDNRLLPLVRYVGESRQAALAGMDGTAYVWDGVREEVVRVRDSASMYRVKSDGDSVTVSELSARTLT